MAAAHQDEASRVTLEAWLVTDVGMVREHNEDSAYMEPANGFFIVADGMGGHAAGEVASAMAVDTVRKTLEAARTEIETFKQAPSDTGRRAIVQLLQSAVLSAHQAVFQRGQHEPDKQGMGTTLDVVLIAGPEAFVAHVGDSRTYLVRDGRSSQITTDHTVAEVLVIEGKLTIEEAQVSPLRTILVNAIGVSADVGVEMAHVTLKREDRLLLCSDGLHDYFPTEDEIAQKLSATAPGDALKDMVELAKTRGGHDNITGVAVHVTDVFEAIPHQLDAGVTEPVDPMSANPFASDEPTETAFVEPPGVPLKVVGAGGPGLTPAQLKTTQPMRIVDDEAVADTIPPPDKRAKPETPSLGAVTSAALKARAARARSDGSGGKPGAKPEAKTDAKPEVKTDAKPEAKTGAEPDTEAKTDAKPEATTEATTEANTDAGPGTATGEPSGSVPEPKADASASGEVDAGGDAKQHGKADANGADPKNLADESRLAGDPARDPGTGDAAPSEIATADTGRIQLPSKDKGTG